MREQRTAFASSLTHLGDIIMNVRRSLPLALTAVATAVLATACAATGTVAAGSGGSASGSPQPSTSAAPISGNTGGSSGGTGSSAPATAPTKSGAATGGTGGTGNAVSDSYAWKHPCDPSQISIEVRYQPSLGSSRRVIVATNHGSAACGLSYFPTVTVGDSTSVGGTSYPTRFVTPKVPGGLGGAPYSPIYAGHSAYAVIDLNPSHTAAGASHQYDELDIQPADFMPHASTTNHTLRAQPANSGNPDVKAPVLSLYQASVADAVKQLNDPSSFR